MPCAPRRPAPKVCRYFRAPAGKPHPAATGRQEGSDSGASRVLNGREPARKQRRWPRMADPILGWKINARDRAELLRRFPPKYERTIADHVTYGRGRHLTLPDIKLAEIVGRV